MVDQITLKQPAKLSHVMLKKKFYGTMPKSTKKGIPEMASVNFQYKQRDDFLGSGNENEFYLVSTQFQMFDHSFFPQLNVAKEQFYCFFNVTGRKMMVLIDPTFIFRGEVELTFYRKSLKCGQYISRSKPFHQNRYISYCYCYGTYQIVIQLFN